MSPPRPRGRSAVVLAPAAIALLLFVGAFFWRNPKSTMMSGRSPGDVSAPQPRQVAPNVWSVPRAARDLYFQEKDRAQEVILLPVSGAERDSVEKTTIARILPGCPLLAAGFRENDRILMVNESPITTLSRAMNLRSEIKSASSLTVRVEREGRIINYRFDFE